MRCQKIIIISIVAAAIGAGLLQQFAIPARAVAPIETASYQAIGSGVNENIAVKWLLAPMASSNCVRIAQPEPMRMRLCVVQRSLREREKIKQRLRRTINWYSTGLPLKNVIKDAHFYHNKSETRVAIKIMGDDPYSEHPTVRHGSFSKR